MFFFFEILPVAREKWRVKLRSVFLSFFFYIVSEGSREYNAYERNEFEICFGQLKSITYHFGIWIKSGNNRSYKIIAIYFFTAYISAPKSPPVYFQIKQWSCLFYLKSKSIRRPLMWRKVIFFPNVCAHQLHSSIFSGVTSHSSQIIVFTLTIDLQFVVCSVLCNLMLSLSLV